MQVHAVRRGRHPWCIQSFLFSIIWFTSTYDSDMGHIVLANFRQCCIDLTLNPVPSSHYCLYYVGHTLTPNMSNLPIASTLRRPIWIPLHEWEMTRCKRVADTCGLWAGPMNSSSPGRRIGSSLISVYHILCKALWSSTTLISILALCICRRRRRDFLRAMVHDLCIRHW